MIMKHAATIFTLLLFSFAATSAYSQALTPEFGLNIHFDDSAGVVRNLLLGYDPRATIGIDRDFGETMAPPFGSPGGAGEAFFIYQNDNQAATDTNIMPKPEANFFTALYTIVAFPS